MVKESPISISSFTYVEYVKLSLDMEAAFASYVATTLFEASRNSILVKVPLRPSASLVLRPTSYPQAAGEKFKVTLCSPVAVTSSSACHVCPAPL
ncbi:MAG: hypothetical protein K2G32_10620 [Oscillospiraceae bacterium]|nr:hypothetical protein [Oscillospiraceae bacterium]